MSTSRTSPSSPAAVQHPRARAGPAARALRAAVLAKLARIEHGNLILHDGPEVHRFGRRDVACGLEARFEVLDPRFYADVALGGAVGAGEAYMDGYWRADDLTAVIRILARNLEVVDRLDGGWARAGARARRALHRLRRNTPGGSRRNVAAHYDLGNELFALFLDEAMMYSCALFPHPQASLEEASRAKLDLVCRKLELGPGDHLLEIGTGWGGLAIHAAREYSCRVTTTTISRRQHELACARVRAAGLEERVQVLRQDYRHLQGRYHKLVSVEMIEAVGHHYYDRFFARCSELLEPDGMMLLQAIVIADQRYPRARREVDFIKRYIFPGSCIPSVQVMMDSVARATDLRLFHLDDIGPHYAATLREWRRRFLAARERVRALGYPERFVRMWEFYLCYCEAGFEERRIGDVQMLLTKPRCRRGPLAGAP